MGAPRDAFTLALPTGKVQVVADARILRLEPPAEFQKGAAAPEARAGRFVAHEARARLAAEFVLPEESGVEFVALAFLVAVPRAGRRRCELTAAKS